MQGVIFQYIDIFRPDHWRVKLTRMCVDARRVRQIAENLRWTIVTEGLDSRPWIAGSGFPPNGSCLGNFLHTMKTLRVVRHSLKGKPLCGGVQGWLLDLLCKSGSGCGIKDCLTFKFPSSGQTRWHSRKCNIKSHIKKR